MSASRAWLLALIGAACVVAACTPSPAPATSGPVTESSATEVGNLPPGCEPIDLRTPSGERVDLDGTWIEVDTPGATPATWWIRTLGDCVWGVGKVDEFPENPGPDTVQHLRGKVRTDFVIEGEIVLVGPAVATAIAATAYARVELIIEFDEAGLINLREDREHGVQGPRCPNPPFDCPRPVVLRRSGSGN